MLNRSGYYRVYHVHEIQLLTTARLSHSVIMSGQPYNIILAGKYGVGKSTLFSYLSRQQGQKSVRSWDKWEHVMTVGKDQVQVHESLPRFIACM